MPQAEFDKAVGSLGHSVRASCTAKNLDLSEIQFHVVIFEMQALWLDTWARHHHGVQFLKGPAPPGVVQLFVCKRVAK